MSCINYSKWDHIEISDDEDETHPNVDTGSLFRWRHQARLERMEQSKKEKDEVEQGLQTSQQKKAEMQRKLKEAETQGEPNLSSLKTQLAEIEKQEKEFKEKEDELRKKEKMAPLNIDTICHDGKSKTIVNKPREKAKELTEEEKAERQEKFQKKHKAEVKKFGMLRKYEDSQEYLTENPQLVCEETANFLVIWCIDLELEEKHELMSHVAHQTIIMNFILELAKNLDNADPRSCVRPFFAKIKLGEKQYMDAFNDELEAFKERVKGRAQARIDAAIKEHEEEERQKRLGPGGLDPVEVFASLPKALQDCFEAKDIGLLQQVIKEMPEEQAAYHIKRCVDSGMWVPEARKGGGEAEEEEVYDTVEETSPPSKESSNINDVD